MSDEDLSQSIAEEYEVEIPERLRRFHATREWEDLGYLHLQRGFLRGWFAPVFDDLDYLCDLSAIGDDFGIDDIDDVDWEDEFGDFVPLAVLEDPDDDVDDDVDDDDDDDLVGAFLVVRVTDTECPVYVWDADGWTLYPLAASLDDFVAGKAWQGKAPVPHDRDGAPYEAFAWADELDDDDDDGDD